MKKFKTKAELKSLSLDYDVSNSGSGPALKCDICSKTYATEAELTAHEIQHMKLTCGICNKNFKNKIAFEQHELNHPKIVENSRDSTEKMSGKTAQAAGHVCLVCKKKFKTAGQLSYHSIHHSDVDIRSAQQEVEPTKKSPASAKTSPATSKPPAAAIKNASRPLVESDSSDEDEDEIASPPPVKKKPVSSPNLKPTTNSMGAVKKAVAAGSGRSPQQEKSSKNSPAATRSPPGKNVPVRADSPPSGRKVKVTCEKCRKKFNDPVALEYHKITFHATATPTAKATADSHSGSGRRGGNSKAKSREYVEDSDDSSEDEPVRDFKPIPITPMSVKPAQQQAAAKRRSDTSTPRSPAKKAKQSSDDSSDEDHEDFDHGAKKNKALLKVNAKPLPSSLKATSLSSGNNKNSAATKISTSKAEQTKKRPPKEKSKKTVVSSDDDEDGIGTTYRKKTASLNTTAISRLVSSKMAAAASSPTTTAVVIKEEGGKNATASVLVAEVELRRNFIAPKSEKVPCDQCGRSMANESVLAYHKIRCTGEAKKAPSKQPRKSDVTSSRKYSSESSDVRLSLDDNDDLPDTKPVPVKPVNSVSKAATTAVGSSDSEKDIDRRRPTVPDVKKTIKKKPSSVTLSSSSSDEEEASPVPSSPPPPLESPENHIFGAKFSRSSFQEISQSELLREKLQSSKGEKVHCEFCHKLFKNETVLQHHNIYCNQPRDEKLKAVSGRPQSGNKVANSLTADKMKSCSSNLVEKSIISTKQRASQSPVDMILKKLSASAQSEDTASHNSESDSASNLSGRHLSFSSTPPAVAAPRPPPPRGGKSSESSPSAAYHEQSEDRTKSSSEDRSPERSPPKGILKPVVASSAASIPPTVALVQKQQTCKVCGISLEHKNVLLKHIRECHDVKISVKKIPKNKASVVSTPPPPVRQDIRTIQKKVSIYTSSEEEEEEKVKRNSIAAAASSPTAAVGLHPNAKHGVEILEEEMNRRRKERKARKEKRKEKKVKKAKRKKNNSSSDEDEEEDEEGKKEEEKKKRKKKKRSRFAIHHSSEDEDEHELSSTGQTKKNPLYCFCDKVETMDMIGCDYCDMWYHPECLGVDEAQVKKLTATNSWMCPECVDNKDPDEEKSRRRSRERAPSSDSVVSDEDDD